MNKVYDSKSDENKMSNKMSDKMSSKGGKTSDRSDKMSDKTNGKNKSDSELHKPCTCHARCNSSKRCPCKASGKSCLSSCHPGHTCTSVECEPSSEIDLTAQPDPKLVNVWWHRPEASTINEYELSYMCAEAGGRPSPVPRACHHSAIH